MPLAAEPPKILSGIAEPERKGKHAAAGTKLEEELAVRLGSSTHPRIHASTAAGSPLGFKTKQDAPVVSTCTLNHSSGLCGLVPQNTASRPRPASKRLCFHSEAELGGPGRFLAPLGPRSIRSQLAGPLEDPGGTSRGSSRGRQPVAAVTQQLARWVARASWRFLVAPQTVMALFAHGRPRELEIDRPARLTPTKLPT